MLASFPEPAKVLERVDFMVGLLGFSTNLGFVLLKLAVKLCSQCFGAADLRHEMLPGAQSGFVAF